MAILTWRDVAAPNLTPAIQAAGQAATLFDRAGSGLQNAIQGFDKEMAAGQNQQVLLNMLQHTNRADYEAALASGALTAGVDPKRLSAATLSALGNRAGDLQRLGMNDLSMQNTQQRMSIEQQDQERKLKMQGISDAAAPGFNSQLSQATGLDMSGVAQLPPDQQAKLADSLTRAQTAGVDAQNAVLNKQRQEQVAGYLARGRTLANQDQARVFLEGIADPVVRNAVYQGLSGQFKGLYGPDAVFSQEGVAGFTPGAGGPTTAGAQGAGTMNGSDWDVVLGGGKYGLPSQPVTEMTIGDIQQFGRDVLIPNSKGAKEFGLPSDQGSSAVGRYQFTQGTLEEYGPKVLGPNWKSQKFTPEVQDKLAEALFNDRKSGNLKATWQGLPNSTAGAYKDVPWSQMRDQIAAVESKTSLSGSQGQQAGAPVNKDLAAVMAPTKENASLQRALQDVQQGSVDSLVKGVTATIDNKLAEIDIDGVGSLIAQFANSNNSSKTVASKLTGKDGPMSGAKAIKVADFIEKKSKEYGVKPEVIGRLVENSASDKSWYNKADWSTTNLGGDYEVADSKIDDALKNFKGGKGVKAVLATYAAKEQAKITEESAKALEAQKQRARQLAGLAQTNPNFAGPAREALNSQKSMEVDMARLLSSMRSNLNQN